MQLNKSLVRRHEDFLLTSAVFSWDLTKNKRLTNPSLQRELLWRRVGRRFCVALICPCLEKSSMTVIVAVGRGFYFERC